MTDFTSRREKRIRNAAVAHLIRKKHSRKMSDSVMKIRSHESAQYSHGQNMALRAHENSEIVQGAGEENVNHVNGNNLDHTIDPEGGDIDHDFFGNVAAAQDLESAVGVPLGSQNGEDEGERIFRTSNETGVPIEAVEHDCEAEATNGNMLGTTMAGSIKFGIEGNCRLEGGGIPMRNEVSKHGAQKELRTTGGGEEGDPDPVFFTRREEMFSDANAMRENNLSHFPPPKGCVQGRIQDLSEDDRNPAAGSHGAYDEEEREDLGDSDDLRYSDSDDDQCEFSDESEQQEHTRQMRLESDGGHGEKMGFTIRSIDMNKIADRQTRRSERRSISSRKCPKSKKKQHSGRKRFLHSKDCQDQSVQQHWYTDLHNLKKRKPDFFTSSQALLEDDAPFQKGKPAYEALPVNQFNNKDLQEVFLNDYDRKVKSGGSYNSFLQLATVSGQFLRLSVVTGRAKLRELWKAGKLYEAICDREVIDLFVDHYDANGQCTTVMTKALHLRKIATHAKLYFYDKNDHFCAQAERSRLKLQKIFNVHKALGRSRATDRKHFEMRAAEGTVFLPRDFHESSKRVRGQLDGICRAFQESKSREGLEKATRIVSQSAVVRKWSINLLLLMIFSAAGQRPQVYCQLQVPDRTELANMKDQVSRVNFFEMRTLFEKTRRSLDMPNVLVPGHVLEYIDFHVKVMREVLLDRTGVNEDNSEERPLFMHTESGEFLTTHQVTRSLKSFLKFHFPDMNNVTVMSLRSSYGTMMMEAFRDRKVFPNMNEEDFLSLLAKNMNTSPEQLVTTYVGIDRQDFEDSARELVKVLAIEKNKTNRNCLRTTGGARGEKSVYDELFA